MSNDTKKEDPKWAHGYSQGHNKALLDSALGMVKLHRIAIEKRLADMKSHVNIECSKLNHPAAREFAEEINKIKIE